jgi:hypothetical protein
LQLCCRSLPSHCPFSPLLRGRRPRNKYTYIKLKLKKRAAAATALCVAHVL